jgi:hypothetical protein
MAPVPIRTAGSPGLVANSSPEYKRVNDFETARSKLAAALEIFTDLNIPRERKAVATQIEKTKGAQA